MRPTSPDVGATRRRGKPEPSTLVDTLTGARHADPFSCWTHVERSRSSSRAIFLRPRPLPPRPSSARRDDEAASGRYLRSGLGTKCRPACLRVTTRRAGAGSTILSFRASCLISISPVRRGESHPDLRQARSPSARRRTRGPLLVWAPTLFASASSATSIPDGRVPDAALARRRGGDSFPQRAR